MALCPHCQHALPETPSDHCPNCGGDLRATIPPPVSTPAPPPPPHFPPPARTGPAPAPGGTPWESRDRLGFLAALVETTRQVLTGPVAFFRSMPTSGGIGGPLLYAVLIGWIGLSVSAFYGAVFQSIVGSSLATLGERRELGPLLALVQGWAGFAFQVIFGAVFVAIGLFVAAGIFHLVLLLVGGARGDFETSLRAVCYAQAPSVLLLVPFCGQLVASIWTLVLYVIGLGEAHRTGYGKSAAAVLLPILLCCCCAAIGLFFFASALAGLVSQIQ